MWGTFVRIRRCSSASLVSGTPRKRDSVACSGAASRKPKMVGTEGAAEFPGVLVDQPVRRIAKERIAEAKSLIGSRVKVSKVAHGQSTVVVVPYIRRVFASRTNFTNFTNWCSPMIY